MILLQKRLETKPTLQDFWVKEEEQPPKRIPSVRKETPISKANSICDGRGLGDGRSCSEDTFADKKEIGNPEMPPHINIASDVVPIVVSDTIPTCPELPEEEESEHSSSHQSETFL